MEKIFINDFDGYKKAVMEAKASTEPYITNKEIVFTDVVPGRKCHDGGEYGFYTHYVPTSVAGVYKCVTMTTCEIDPCGTGDCGYKFMSASDYARMRAKSDAIIACGSKY